MNYLRYLRFLILIYPTGFALVSSIAPDYSTVHSRPVRSPFIINRTASLDVVWHELVFPSRSHSLLSQASETTLLVTTHTLILLDVKFRA
jgi:hypothetical protein